MDTTKQYILMCEKAEEIQEKHFYSRGDFYFNSKSNYSAACVCERALNDKWNQIQCRFIWLPRQDELKEMVKKPLNILITDFDEFHTCIGGVTEGTYSVSFKKYSKQFNSMEQLWLAFVMKEKYNKTWNGKKWGKSEAV